MSVAQYEGIISTFRKDIVKREDNLPNNSGYGYCASEKVKVTLRNGNYIVAGMCFSSSKAKSVPYCNLYDKDNNLIKYLLN